MFSRDAAEPSALPRLVRTALAEAGTALPTALCESSESRFGMDVAGLRVHTGSAATRASQALASKAFTFGRDIVLAQAASLRDAGLMTHEIAHALQPVAPGGAPLFGRRGSSAEVEADNVSKSSAISSRSSETERFPVATLQPPVVQRSALIHCTPASPATTVIESGYLLYTADQTKYDSATRQLFLDPADQFRLLRLHGLYLIERPGFGHSLIAPPEVRLALGVVGLFFALSTGELGALRSAGRKGAAQFVIDLVQRRHNVRIRSIGLSSGSDRDFADATLPESVGAALREPLADVSPGDAPGVNAARATALGASQQRTLRMATAREEVLPGRPLRDADKMSVHRLFGVGDPERAAWYVNWLGPFQAQLAESAAAHRLPMQLLAAVVLNELADIDSRDVLQSQTFVVAGSLGIGQIQVETARDNKLIDLSRDAHLEGWANSAPRVPGTLDSAQRREVGLNMRIAQLLQVPQVAIEAAAREVEGLIVEMAAHHGKPWQVAHGFVAPGPLGAAIYALVGSGSDMEREGTLADAVCGAYNSPKVIPASDTTGFRNATVHGANANELAQDLYRFRLFRGV